jgi:uncharacterized protein
MVALYIASMDSSAGKTVLALGLARRMAGDGLSVGYIRPLTTALKQIESAQTCAAVMKQSLGLLEPMDVLNPVIIDGAALESIFAEKFGNPTDRVLDAFKITSTGKDLVMVEGVSGLTEGAMVGLDAQATVELLDARCLLVLRARNEMVADPILEFKKRMGDRMLGVVLNAVPMGMQEFATETLAPFLERRGVKVYAVLPEDRLMMAVRVGELVDRLGGRVISGQAHLDELVEGVMVGAMSVENALTFFRRRANKAVITGGDRPDIQLAALETSTKCLILTGNLYPSPMILGRADELGVPVILVQQDTLTAAGLVEQAFAEVQFHQPKKIEHFQTLLDSHLKYEEIRRDLGLPARA